MLSSKETRKHSINLTERLLNDSVIGFGFKERKVDKITRKQVFSNLTRTIAKSTLEKSIEDMAPILQGQSGYHQLIVDQKIPMNQPDKSILERLSSKLITEEDEAYFRLSFEEQLKTKDTSNEPQPPQSFEYSTSIPKVITTEKSKVIEPQYNSDNTTTAATVKQEKLLGAQAHLRTLQLMHIA